MKTQNKVQLIGYVGNEPTLFTAVNGSKKLTLRVATDQYFKKENGEPFKKTTWHDIVAWEKTAEIAAVDFSKGSHILVEGKINYRTYEDKNGHTRYVTEIKASTFMNLDR